MENLLDSIKLALAADATAEARAAGAHSCRVLLARLEAAADTPNAAVPIAGIAELASVLRGMPMDQILDLAIVKLRAVAPAADAAPVQRLAIPFVPVRQP